MHSRPPPHRPHRRLGLPPAGAGGSSARPGLRDVVLVDELNRVMPRTQSAPLEAMAERQVTIDGVRVRGRAVLRRRHAEPHRAGGDVPAPRGAARPLRAARQPLGYPDGARRCRSSSRSATAIQSRRLRPVVTTTSLATCGRDRGRSTSTAAGALDGRARPRDARGRGSPSARRCAATSPSSGPHARVHSSRGATTSFRRTSEAVPARARPPARARRRRTPPRPEARPRGGARADPARCLELAPPPAPDWDG